MFNWLSEGVLLTALLNEFNNLKYGHSVSSKDAISRLARDFLADKGRLSDGNYNFAVCKKVAILLQIKELYNDDKYQY